MAKSKRRNVKKVEVKKDKEEEVNYGKIADTFADDDDDDDVPSEEENDHPNNSDHEENSEDDDDDDEEEDDEQMNHDDDEEQEDNDDDDDEEEDDDDDDDDEEEDEGNDVNALFKGTAGADDSDQDSGSDEDDGDETELRVEAPSGATKGGPEQCNFDLRNLTAMNSHQIPSSSLYSTKKVAGEESISIPMDQGHDLRVNEDFLLDRASSACAQLIAAIWQLPTEMSDAGPLAVLPSYNEIALPRAMVRVDIRIRFQIEYRILTDISLA